MNRTMVRSHPRPAALAGCFAAALLAVAASGAAGAEGTAIGLPPEALAPAASAAEVAWAATHLPPGGRLRVEGLALEPRQHVALELTRFEVFAPDAEIVVHGDGGDTREPVPDHAWYRGFVAGAGQARAVLIARRDGTLRGMISDRGRLWALGERREEGARDGALVAEEVPPALLAAAGGFRCELEDGPVAAAAAADAALRLAEPLESVATAATSTLYTARVAVETDWELMQRVNGNAAAAAAYIGDLLAYASTIYDSEVKTDVVIGHLSLWATSADPWGQTSSTCALLEFGRHWNDNEAGVGRTLALFLSGKGTGGGVAWVGVLCEGGFNVNLNGSCPALTPTIDNYGGAYAFVGSVSGTSFDLDNPTAAWDIVATNHEMGHNFDSPHTHCYEGIGGNPEAVDQCYGGQCESAGCYCGSPVLPGCSSGGGCGTIMSYCHLLAGGFTNISLTLGAGHPFGVQPQRVPDRMRQHVESRAALLPSCLARQTPCDDLEVSDATISSAATYATCGTLTAGPELLVTPSGYLTLQARTVVLRDGFSVAAGGRLRVISPP